MEYPGQRMKTENLQMEYPGQRMKTEQTTR